MPTPERLLNLTEGLNALAPKQKAPQSGRILNTWILQCERAMGAPPEGGRLSWLVASTVAIAALQRAVDDTGGPRFLLKGGTLLQHRLQLAARATRDVDGMIRGDIDSFISSLDASLKLDWGPLVLRRGQIETISAPSMVTKPRRFRISLILKGATWRSIQVEISPEEGSAGKSFQGITPPPLDRLGLPTPDRLLGIALQYQIAQKVHAATDPHDPPLAVNHRARDVVDLLLLRDLTISEQHPTPLQIRSAILDVFSSRARQAAALGVPEKHWPVRVMPYSHWVHDFDAAAASAGLEICLPDGVAQVNDWLDSLDGT